MSPGDNPSGTDNQQGSLNSTDLAWIAGFWDGDGWIGITKAKRSVTKKNRYTASVMATTTSDRIASRVIDIMTRMGTPPTTQNKRPVEKKSTWSGKNVWHREKWNITIRSNKNVQVFLRQIRPFLVEKGVCADLVLRYTDWRDTLPKQGPGLSETVAREAENISALLRADRQRNDPSETIRSGLEAKI